MSGLKEFWQWFIAEDLDEYKDDINLSNRATLRRFSYAGIFLCVLNTITQLLTREKNAIAVSGIQMLYFVCLALSVRKYQKNKNVRHATADLYICISIALGLAVLNGTMMDSEHYSFTFVIYSAVFALLIVDKPWHLALYISVWPLIFIPLSLFYKPYDIFMLDALHAITAWACALMASLVILTGRLDAIKSHHKLLVADSTDELTGLYNRKYFLSRGQTMINARTMPEEAAIVFYDFIGLRNFNRDFSFTAGDELLKAFAEILREVYPERLIARFGEDHFVVLAYQEEWKTNRDALLKKLDDYLMESHGRHLVYSQSDLHVGNADGLHIMIKCGVCNVDRKVKFNIACDHARVACHSISVNDPGMYRVYDDDLEKKNEREEYILDNVDLAIQNGWIQVYYQPIVRSMTDEMCGEEALTRWIDPVKGFMPPADFIPILEEHKLLYKVDLFVVEQVLRDFQAKQDAGVALVPVSVNLSRTDFEGRDMVKAITERMDAVKCPHNLIDIEITESAYSENPEKIMKQVDRFHAAGFSVWMDDFGSGYSSLNLLQDSRFDLIKLDMQFMRDFGPKNEILINSIISMANHLGIDTLAEGVETSEQRRFLRSIGCERLQGYYYSKPVPLDAAMKTASYREDRSQSYDYYEALSHVDMSDPFAYFPDSGVSGLSDSLPAVIVEWHPDRDTIAILRANESFATLTNKYLKQDINFDEVGMRRHECLLDAEKFPFVKAFADAQRWSSFSAMMQNTPVTFYGHYIDRNPKDGSTAVLIVCINAAAAVNSGETVKRAQA